jgi:photosystem II stability/assembly factor-like uncharacterized protein
MQRNLFRNCQGSGDALFTLINIAHQIKLHKMKTFTRLMLIMLLAIAPVVSHAQWQLLPIYHGFFSVEVNFYDFNTGAVFIYGMGEKRVMVTTDGGITFDTVFSRPSITPCFLINQKYLNFLDSSTLYVLDNDRLHITNDLGTTWDSVMLPQSFNNMVFLNDTIATGQAGTSLLRSNNRGVTWQTLLSGIFPPLFSYEFPHPDTGYVLDADTIRFTYDGGITWSSQPSLPGYDIFFPSDSTWFGVRSALDSIYIVKTTDKGSSWSSVFQDYIPYYAGCSIRFPDKETGYIGVSRNTLMFPLGGNRLLGTGDGGDTWEWHNNFFGMEYIRYIHCIGSDTVYVLDEEGFLFRTINGSDYTRRASRVYATTPLYEPCGTGMLYVALNFQAQDTMVVHFDAMFGTATNGVDFVHIPDSVVFLPGMDVLHIPILVIDDTIVEGPEFYSVVIHTPLYSDTATFWIHDEVPVPLSYSINPTERIACLVNPQTGFFTNISGGASPYTVTWYNTFGVLSQQYNFSNQPPLPYHSTVYFEIIDKAMCNPIIDSVQLWYFDSCKVEIQSSHPGPVQVGVPVTYSLVHECPTAGLNNRWLINGVLTQQNTQQITHTWSQTGVNTISVQVMHLCGQLNIWATTDVITSVEALASNVTMKVSQTGNASWLLAGEGLPSGNLSLQVFDIGGRLIHQHQLHTESGVLHHTLNLPNHAPGIYLLHVVSENGFSFREKVLSSEF